jgi:hypothetical protein
MPRYDEDSYRMAIAEILAETTDPNRVRISMMPAIRFGYPRRCEKFADERFQWTRSVELTEESVHRVIGHAEATFGGRWNLWDSGFHEVSAFAGVVPADRYQLELSCELEEDSVSAAMFMEGLK